MKQDAGAPIKTNEVCLECGSSRLTEQIKEQQFPFGPPAAQTTLTAAMPVFTCQDCGYEFFDERGESARHDAVCRHLGVQTPDEIRAARDITGLGRAEFCEIGGFGIASLQRWESGQVIPNASSDRLIYLLQYDDNINRLKARNYAGKEQPIGTATSGPHTESEAPSSIRLVEVHRPRIRASLNFRFPALERQGELVKCSQEAKRIQRRGSVFAPMV
jgi:putative zinc finger/helix-turn-helix YgiT family protein